LVHGEILSKRPFEDLRIWLYDLRSGQVSILSRSNGLWIPRWSPNGRCIAALTPGGAPPTLHHVLTREDYAITVPE
jgi:Tol biopolymer transport system component